MSKETLVFCLGFIITLLPTLGIPELWRQYGLMAAGILLILVGYLLRRSRYLSRIDRGNGARADEAFVETTEKLFE